VNEKKVKYWNGLRTLVNKWLLVLCSIIFIVTILINRVELFYIFNFIEGAGTSIFLYSFLILLNLMGYVILINFILLMFEVIDRVLNFKEKSSLKIFFIFLFLLFFLAMPFLFLFFKN